MISKEGVLLAIDDDRDYDAAVEELDGLVLSEPGTPPGRRFDELVQLIDEYAARTSGYVLMPRDRHAGPRSNVISLQQRIGKSREILHRSPG